jgi:hypothetical protein
MTTYKDGVCELELDTGAFITILSKRKTGKSVLISDLIHFYLTKKKDAIDFVYLFSNTAYMKSGTNSQYDFIDDKVLIPATSTNIRKIVGTVETDERTGGTKLSGLFRSQASSKFKFNILIVFDDINVGKKDTVIESLATAGRHFMITTVLSCQIANQAVSPAIRNNTSYLFWRRLNDNSLKDNIYPIAGSAFNNYKELIYFTEQAVGDYKFVFYNNDKDIEEDSLQIVKAKEAPAGFKYIVNFPEPKLVSVRHQGVGKFNKYGIRKGAMSEVSLMKPRKNFK